MRTTEPAKEKAAKKRETSPSPALKYWIDLAKWFLVSIVIVVATKIIDTGFKDRERSLSELKEYGNYVTQLIVLNPSPVNKYELARYMVCVTTSDAMRKGWQAWFDSIYPEYVRYVDQIEAENILLTEEIKSLREVSPPMDLTRPSQVSLELQRLEEQLKINLTKLQPAFVLPDNHLIGK